MILSIFGELKLFLLIAFFISITSFLIFSDQFSSFYSNDKTNNIGDSAFPKPKHEINGFSYSRFEKGEKLFMIRADKLSIQKKKIGFYRFGLISEIIIDHAFIRLHKTHNLIDNRDIVLFDYVAERGSSLFSVKRIVSITMKPVEIKYYHYNTLISQIRSNSAVIALGKQKMLFKGNVIVMSGKRYLTANRMTLFQDNIIKTDGGYILKTERAEKKGKQIMMDIFLNIKGNT